MLRRRIRDVARQSFPAELPLSKGFAELDRKLGSEQSLFHDPFRHGNRIANHVREESFLAGITRHSHKHRDRGSVFHRMLASG